MRPTDECSSVFLIIDLAFGSAGLLVGTPMSLTTIVMTLAPMTDSLALFIYNRTEWMC